MLAYRVHCVTSDGNIQVIPTYYTHGCSPSRTVRFYLDKDRRIVDLVVDTDDDAFKYLTLANVIIDLQGKTEEAYINRKTCTIIHRADTVVAVPCDLAVLVFGKNESESPEKPCFSEDHDSGLDWFEPSDLVDLMNNECEEHVLQYRHGHRKEDFTIVGRTPGMIMYDVAMYGVPIGWGVVDYLASNKNKLNVISVNVGASLDEFLEMYTPVNLFRDGEIVSCYRHKQFDVHEHLRKVLVLGPDQSPVIQDAIVEPGPVTTYVKLENPLEDQCIVATTEDVLSHVPFFHSGPTVTECIYRKIYFYNDRDDSWEHNSIISVIIFRHDTYMGYFFRCHTAFEYCVPNQDACGGLCTVPVFTAKEVLQRIVKCDAVVPFILGDEGFGVLPAWVNSFGQLIDINPDRKWVCVPSHYKIQNIEEKRKHPDKPLYVPNDLYVELKKLNACDAHTSTLTISTMYGVTLHMDQLIQEYVNFYVVRVPIVQDEVRYVNILAAPSLYRSVKNNFVMHDVLIVKYQCDLFDRDLVQCQLETFGQKKHLILMETFFMENFQPIFYAEHISVLLYTRAFGLNESYRRVAVSKKLVTCCVLKRIVFVEGIHGDKIGIYAFREHIDQYLQEITVVSQDQTQETLYMERTRLLS